MEYVERLQYLASHKSSEHEDWLLLTVFYFVVCWVAHFASSIVSKALVASYTEYEKEDKKTKQTKLTKRTFKEKIEWDMMVVSLFASGAMFTLYFLTFLEFYWNGSGVAERWSGTSLASMHAIIMHISCSLYEACTYLLSSKRPEFYLHHVLVIGNCGTMLLADRCHLWCAWLGLVEGTNVPLCTLTILREVPALKGGFLYVLSGVSLWISYVILRVVSAPICIWLIYEDSTNYPDVAWISENAQYNTGWLYFVYLSAAFLWGLSMYWFWLITKGLLKAVGLTGDDKKKSA